MERVLLSVLLMVWLARNRWTRLRSSSKSATTTQRSSLTKFSSKKYLNVWQEREPTSQQPASKLSSSSTKSTSYKKPINHNFRKLSRTNRGWPMLHLKKFRALTTSEINYPQKPKRKKKSPTSYSVQRTAFFSSAPFLYYSRKTS